MAARLKSVKKGLILVCVSSAGAGNFGVDVFVIFISFLAEFLCVHVVKQESTTSVHYICTSLNTHTYVMFIDCSLVVLALHKC